MTVDRALRILGRGYTREEARRLVTVCGLLLDAAESALNASAAPSAQAARGPLPCPAGRMRESHPLALSAAEANLNPCEP